MCKVILHAQCMALSVSVDQALILKETLMETVYGEKKGPFNIPINVFTDCYSLFQNIHSDNLAQDRKVRVEVAAIREQMDLKEINSIKWVPDESQLTNPLTKSTGPATRLIEVLQSGRLNAAELFVCKIPLLARRTRPSARATIGYLVYNRIILLGDVSRV